MSEIPQTNNIPYNTSAGTPLYNYSNGAVVPQIQPQTVSVGTPNNAQIYNYPQTSIYPGQQQPASGVNIYIYNPSAVGGPTANATYGVQGQVPQTAPMAQTPLAPANNVQPQQSMTIANTPIGDDGKDGNSKKTKNIVELTNDYIKTLESYVKSGDKNIRRNGIKEIIKRFEEDDSRYDDPALTALLNIALMDPDASNRLMAMSVISSGSAHGDKNTVELLTRLQSSDKLFGQEAVMANKALLKTSETRLTVNNN